MLHADSVEITFDLENGEFRTHEIKGVIKSREIDENHTYETMFNSAECVERVNFVFRNKVIIVKNLVITRFEREISIDSVRQRADFVCTDAYVIPREVEQLQALIPPLPTH